mgnify:CR=1 FL=1
MPTVESIRAYAAENKVGLLEAKHILTCLERRAQIASLRREGSLEAKIDWLLDRYEETLSR